MWLTGLRDRGSIPRRRTEGSAAEGIGETFPKSVRLLSPTELPECLLPSRKSEAGFELRLYAGGLLQIKLTCSRNSFSFALSCVNSSLGALSLSDTMQTERNVG